MMVRDGEKALWVTERSQLPNGEWRIMVWLNTTDSALSNQVHKDVAALVRARMLEAEALRLSPQLIVQPKHQKRPSKQAKKTAHPSHLLGGLKRRETMSRFDDIFEPVYAGISDDDSVTKAKEELADLFNEEHARAVSIGMGRAKTAITVAMNTGSTTMHELRDVLDNEIEVWNKLYEVES